MGVEELRQKAKVVSGAVRWTIGVGSAPRKKVFATGVQMLDTSRKRVTARQMGQQGVVEEQVEEEFVVGAEAEEATHGSVRVKRRIPNRDNRRC